MYCCSENIVVYSWAISARYLPWVVACQWHGVFSCVSWLQVHTLQQTKCCFICICSSVLIRLVNVMLKVNVGENFGEMLMTVYSVGTCRQLGTIRAFSFASPMMWDSLPTYLHDPVHITSVFGWLLKTFLPFRVLMYMVLYIRGCSVMMCCINWRFTYLLIYLLQSACAT